MKLLMGFLEDRWGITKHVSDLPAFGAHGVSGVGSVPAMANSDNFSLDYLE